MRLAVVCGVIGAGAAFAGDLLDIRAGARGLELVSGGWAGVGGFGR